MKSAGKSAYMQRESSTTQHAVRLRIVLVVLLLAAVGLIARAVELQLVDHGFLADQGDSRYTRVMQITAHRGTIIDRYGEPLAVSTPVDSVWANPKELSQAADSLPQLARALQRDREGLARQISSNIDREFVYLKRHLQPDQAERIRALGIPGVHLLREYRRYYPAGEVAGHVLGFTDVDDSGQEGLELAFDHWLTGQNGAKRVIQDRLGRVVENIESIREPQPGKDLVLSMDLRIQYLAYRELKRALQEQDARAGSVIVLDVQTGEVLAMVNQPAFNPNDREQRTPARYRNRAVTDIFEPGSSMKPFVMAAALASGRYRLDSLIDTRPGFMEVGNYVFRDVHPVGVADLTTVIAQSSNVGMAKIALNLDREKLWRTLDGLGFGQVSTSGFPGESAGLLNSYSHWRPVVIASMSRGYGLSVTPLQLARAYAVLGAGGVSRPITFLLPGGASTSPGLVEASAAEPPDDTGRVIGTEVMPSLMQMLEAVVSSEGTGKLATVHGYRVAGKTGTAWKAAAGGYSHDKYRATFGGIAPATRPRLACVVMIDEPGKQHSGGEVSAPVFAAVMAGALRLMAVPPDDLPDQTDAAQTARIEQTRKTQQIQATVAQTQVRP